MSAQTFSTGSVAEPIYSYAMAFGHVDRGGRPVAPVLIERGTKLILLSLTNLGLGGQVAVQAGFYPAADSSVAVEPCTVVRGFGRGHAIPDVQLDAVAARVARLLNQDAVMVATALLSGRLAFVSARTPADVESAQEW